MLNYFLLIIFIKILFVNLSQQQGNVKLKGYCPKGWDRWKESCYFISDQKRMWFSAIEECKSMDTAAVLADIKDFEENLYLQQLIQEKGYQGCYNDALDRLLPDNFMESVDGLTNEMCINYCRSKGYKYAGTQYSIQCFCGTNTNKYSKTDIGDCSTMCSGNKTERCGGHWKLSVYEIDRSQRWIGGICTGNDMEWKWHFNKQPVSGYINWKKEVGPCEGTFCMSIGPPNPGYKWSKLGCLHKLKFICKAPVKYKSLLQKNQKTVCVNTCEGMSQGHYQACARCDSYISCIGNRMYSRRCPEGLIWDDYVKGCRYASTTCIDLVQPKAIRRQNRQKQRFSYLPKQ